MALEKSKKKHQHKLFHRKSLLGHPKPKRHLRHHLHALEARIHKRIIHIRYYVHNLYQSYRSLCLLIAYIFRIFILIDQVLRELFAFIEKIIQVIRVIYGWIQMVRAILSAIHLIISRIMLLSSCIHRICYLLSILLQPFSNGKFEKVVRSFSYFISYYYSSNGACYTLQARTRQIVGRVRERWGIKRHYNMNDDDDDNMFYDASNEECAYF
ncbi:unnamed protein product [Rotaria magnacalcarata]|uniref:Uncharacterized protein n=1 Tax=Rotaria magnacalcarata TaxID=392030 RepID=A0A815Z8A8_9BILA|nr:unnamed protein product [Rotaria magnacalcarata]CAF1638683.1 unnamed protein product [Rotaria magnacalcarata]CAF2140481.1 unnamed protein product [Rotaria magnacalcarata]CAF3935545.1 unnamed protein product [Rotaria magnacalcarata]CAF4081435.1 unnamed protein product [Rotaria magnacalcarata]